MRACPLPPDHDSRWFSWNIGKRLVFRTWSPRIVRQQPSLCFRTLESREKAVCSHARCSYHGTDFLGRCAAAARVRGEDIGGDPNVTNQMQRTDSCFLFSLLVRWSVGRFCYSIDLVVCCSCVLLLYCLFCCLGLSVCCCVDFYLFLRFVLFCCSTASSIVLFYRSVNISDIALICCSFILFRSVVMLLVLSVLLCR